MMIDLFKRFVSSAVGPGKDIHPADDYKLSLATCALLVEMARIDESFTDQETAAILHILETQYGVSEEHSKALVAEAEKELEESVDLWQFAHLINDQYSREEKIRIIETLWQVVFVDGKLDQYEDYLMHKMANLLRLTHKELMDAKLKILHGESRSKTPTQGALDVEPQ
jgi:uncharacterized tellurite resistance protein B-like protein